MLEHSSAPHPESLEIQALLYVCGEMEPEAAAAFEIRLADDQGAREALVGAAGTWAALTNGRATHPLPGYREEVRRRLEGDAGSPAQSRLGRRGKALVWALTGAAAASVAFVAHGYFDPSHPGAPTEARQGTVSPAAAVVSGPAQEAADYADISNIDRVERIARIASEGAKRKQRDETRFLNTQLPCPSQGRRGAM